MRRIRYFYIYKIKGHKVKEGIKVNPQFKRSKDHL